MPIFTQMKEAKQKSQPEQLLKNLKEKPLSNEVKAAIKKKEAYINRSFIK